MLAGSTQGMAGTLESRGKRLGAKPAAPAAEINAKHMVASHDQPQNRVAVTKRLKSAPELTHCLPRF
jgi:hypothetical protein